MNLDLINKTALISGSTKGIGFAIANQLVTEGAKVILNGRSKDSVATALEQIRNTVPEAKIEGFVGDFSRADSVEELLLHFPTVDILVNNLGIYEIKTFEEISDADWQRFFEINVLSGVRLSRAYLPAMKQQNWGRIIFISSQLAIQTPSYMLHYGVTKTAQLAVARGLAESCAGTNVTVNSILPGATHTPSMEKIMSEMSGGQSLEVFEKDFFTNMQPNSLIKRFEKPEEIASLVTFICSPVASGINGTALRVDGGAINSCF